MSEEQEKKVCGKCGAPMVGSARFCGACGADQTEFATQTHEQPADLEPEPTPEQDPASAPEPHPAQPGESQPSPTTSTTSASATAGQLATELRTALSTPAVLAVLVAALIGAGITFAVAVVLAAVFPDESVIGVFGTDVSIFRESAAQAVQLVAAAFTVEAEGQSISLRVAPAILILIPLLACAVGAAVQARVTTSMAPLGRLACGAATGVPFALLMLIPALSAGELGGGEFAGDSVKASVAGTFFLSLLWGTIGGTFGAHYAIRSEPGYSAAGFLPERSRIWAGVLGALAKPFAYAFVLAALVATGIWLVQTIRDEGDTRAFEDGEDRSLALSLVENSLLFGDLGMNTLSLGAGAEFKRPRAEFEPDDSSRPLPIGSMGFFEGEEDPDFDFGSGDQDSIFYSGTYRIFQYSEATEPYVFIPLLIVLIAIPALFALYAGFAAARRHGTSSLAVGAGIGAVAGPVWALLAVIVNAVVSKELAGEASGDSVFVMFLLGGAVLGALGGLLATRSTAQPLTHDSAPHPPAH